VDFLAKHVHAHDAEIADAFGDELRDVVVAHQQHVHRHVLAEADQLVAAAAVDQPAGLHQVQRVVGQPAGLLYGNLDALLCLDRHVESPSNRSAIMR
jgi:hypothetical protein